MYDAIDVRLYLCRRRNNYDCTLNNTTVDNDQYRPNTDNEDVEK